jgi:hypothetical protein
MPHLREVIATDIPEPAAAPGTAPLAFDDDITRRDAWLFAPLVAAAITLPILMTAVLGFSAWHLINNEASLSAPASSFASRWPDKELPVVTSPL